MNGAREITSKNKRAFQYSVREKKKFSFIYITLILPIVHIIVFWFYVNFSSIFLAFKDTTTDKWTLDNIKLVIDAVCTGSLRGQTFTLYEIVGKSVLIWILNNMVSFTVSLLTAFILTKHMIGSKLFRTIYYIPGIVGGVVFSRIMMGIYAQDGPIVRALGIGTDIPDVFLGGLLASDKTAFWTLFIQQFVLGISGGNMIVAGAYMKIPEEIFESAKLEGCGFFRETFQIAIPCTWPTISTMLTFSLCGFFVADLNFYLYSGGMGNFGMNSVGFYLYSLEASLALNGVKVKWIYGYASAFGLFITFITIPLVMLGRFVLTKMNDMVEF